MKTRLLTVLISVGLVAAACGGGGDDASSPDTPAAEPPITATLNGSGATFPKAFYEVDIEAYRSVQPGVTINYEAIGSGAGRQKLQDGVVDFAGSDAPVKPADLPKYKGEILYFPTVAAPITVSYNLPGLRGLKLDAETLARIFQRQVRVWNDPAIAALNPGVDLPSTTITVAHRSDGSGTTENFTQFLVLAAPDVWTLKSGSTVEWPADTQAGNGNAGVAQAVKSTPGAIGYVDLSDARASGLQYAQVKNKAGRFVAPTLEGAEAALAGSRLNPDLTYSPLNADGDAAYPITAPTWIIAYKNQPDKNKGAALKSFLTYTLTDGQEVAGDVDFARLPAAIHDKAVAQVDNLVVPTT